MVFPYHSQIVWYGYRKCGTRVSFRYIVWYESVGKKSLFIKINEKICDENLSIKKSLGYSYTVFKLKGSKCFSTEDIDKVTIRNFDHQFVCMTEMKLDKAKASNYTN